MPELKEQLQRTLGDNYSLERELGGGGMSRVFVAEELSLGRKSWALIEELLRASKKFWPFDCRRLGEQQIPAVLYLPA